MDLNMPIMSGYEAATKITALFSEHPIANQLVSFGGLQQQNHQFEILFKHTIPVMVAVSANEASRDLLESLERCGFDEYVQAPLKVSDI
jgi:CheY-like chemotaxis protein